jgi:hypothetical protein
MSPYELRKEGNASIAKGLWALGGHWYLFDVQTQCWINIE